MKKLVLFIFFGLLIAAYAYGHLSGFTYETSTDKYFVDIGTTKTTIPSNELMLFDYNLYRVEDRNNLADFDSVYVTISNDSEGVIYSGLVHRASTDALTVLSYSFPKAGEYKMSAAFEKEQGKLAEVEFPIKVESSGLNSNWIKLTGVAVLIGLVAGFAIGRGLKLSSQ